MPKSTANTQKMMTEQAAKLRSANTRTSMTASRFQSDHPTTPPRPIVAPAASHWTRPNGSPNQSHCSPCSARSPGRQTPGPSRPIPTRSIRSPFRRVSARIAPGTRGSRTSQWTSKSASSPIGTLM